MSSPETSRRRGGGQGVRDDGTSTKGRHPVVDAPSMVRAYVDARPEGLPEIKADGERDRRRTVTKGPPALLPLRAWFAEPA